MLKNLILKIIGKKMGEKVAPSKTKITAIVYVIMQAIPIISQAFGHPIAVPDYIYRILEAAGLWSVRDAIKS